VHVVGDDLRVEALRLRAAPAALRQSVGRLFFERGEYGKTYWQRRFRTGGTTATRTARRTSKLHDAIGASVKESGDKITLDFGLVRPETTSEVLGYARVHEGIDAGGNEVSQFIIEPKKAGVLSWVGPNGRRVFARRVVLKPRPGLRPTFERMTENVEGELLKLADQAVGG
jgi:hypothetical protein